MHIPLSQLAFAATAVSLGVADGAQGTYLSPSSRFGLLSKSTFATATGIFINRILDREQHRESRALNQRILEANWDPVVREKYRGSALDPICRVEGTDVLSYQLSHEERKEIGAVLEARVEEPLSTRSKGRELVQEGAWSIGLIGTAYHIGYWLGRNTLQ